MTVVSGHVRRVVAGHAPTLQNEVLEDLVEGGADMDSAVCVRRTVVEDEGRRTAPDLTQLPVEIDRLPAGNRLRLGCLEVRLHRKTCFWQVYRVFPLGHTASLYRSRPTYNAEMVHEQVLDNGLKVLIQEEHTAPLASVWCWYKVGSKDEGPGVTGVSHWVEHMNFKGTTNIPREQVKGIIEQFGGFWNGYTWIDQTTYVETATRDALDRMLFIEAERMANCLYHPDDCDSERTVIISELQGGENDPDQLLDQELTAAAFKAHPYRHPTIGWLSDLQTMTREDLYGYYRRHYVPNNATLVIVGDVDADEALRRAREHFGKIPPGPAARRRHTAEPEQIGERRVTVS